MQALVTSASPFGAPRRNANGIDIKRVAHILAVLEKRIGMQISNQDVFIHVPGGLKISEPAADLAVALAVASSFRDIPVNPNVVCFGEVGLTGELRTVSHADRRIIECGRLGFKTCICPPGKPPKLKSNITCQPLRGLNDVFNIALNR